MPKLGITSGNGDNLPEKASNEPIPVITEPRCKVCMSPNRKDIELMVARGYNFHEISRQLQATGQDIGYRSVERHSKNHMKMREAAFRSIMEKQAQELLEVQGEGALRVVSGKAFLDLFIQEATDLLVAGEMEIEARDVVKAIELRELLEKEGITFFQEQVMKELQAIIQAIKETIPAEIARQISIRAQEIVQTERLKELEAAEEAEFEEI